MSEHMCRNQVVLNCLLRRCYRQRRQRGQKVLTLAFSLWAEEGRYTICMEVNAYFVRVHGLKRTMVLYGQDPTSNLYQVH